PFRLPAKGEAQASDEVLAEVDDEPSTTPIVDRDRPDSFGHPHRGVDLGHEPTRIGRGDDGVAPGIDVLCGKVPGGVCATRVLVLSHQQIGVEDVTGALLPPFTGCNDASPTLCPVAHQLGEERRFRAVVLGLVAPIGTDETHVPPVREQSGDAVAAGGQVVGHVPRLVGDAVPILRPPRYELVPTDTATVDVEPVDALGGGMHLGAHGHLVEFEVVDVAAYGLQLVHRVTDVCVLRRKRRTTVGRVGLDPGGTPFVGVHDPGRTSRGRGGDLSGVVLDLDRPLVVGGGGERSTLVT